MRPERGATYRAFGRPTVAALTTTSASCAGNAIPRSIFARFSQATTNSRYLPVARTSRSQSNGNGRVGDAQSERHPSMRSRDVPRYG
jgi:hypothetical protein